MTVTGKTWALSDGRHVVTKNGTDYPIMGYIGKAIDGKWFMLNDPSHQRYESQQEAADALVNKEHPHPAALAFRCVLLGYTITVYSYNENGWIYDVKKGGKTIPAESYMPSNPEEAKLMACRLIALKHTGPMMDAEDLCRKCDWKLIVISRSPWPIQS